jgi:hypothetical protein
MLEVESKSLPDLSVSLDDAPREMARNICQGFLAHDRGDRGSAVEAFEFVDALQFRDAEPKDVHLAADALVGALWAKDDIEVRHLRDGALDEAGLAEADWGPVRKKFRERAALLGIDQEYAELKTEAWRRHKTGGDYWTPFQRAQLLELRAALGDPDYPGKPKEGRSGPGPEALRYALAVELHDMHTRRHWEQAEEAMVPYFERIVAHHAHE